MPFYSLSVVFHQQVGIYNLQFVCLIGWNIIFEKQEWYIRAGICLQINFSYKLYTELFCNIAVWLRIRSSFYYSHPFEPYINIK